VGITLDQILLLSGPLTDDAGFDSPRARYRRFLTDHVRDTANARDLIQQCQHAPGDQAQRALGDLVALLGRFLGFDVIFAGQTGVVSPAHAGWRLRSRVRVVLDVRADHHAAAPLDGLLQSAQQIRDEARPGTRVVALSVLTPPYLGRARLEAAIAATESVAPIRIVMLDALLSLSAMADSGRLSSDDVAELLAADMPLDFAAELLRKAGGGGDSPSIAPSAPRVLAAPDDRADDLPGPVEPPRSWLITIGPDSGMSAPEVLNLLVIKRGIIGVSDVAGTARAVRAGESVCFYITGRGVVGHARVASLGTGEGGLRGAHRFKQLLHLDRNEVSIHTPVPADLETELRLTAARAHTNRPAQLLLEVSGGSFAALTRPRAHTVSEPRARP
jgi:hypothetical protein